MWVPRATLSLDQFSDIVEFFKAACKSVDVTMDRFRLEHCSETEVQEVRERLRTSRVYSLEISGSEPTIRLSLGNSVTSGLYVDDADDVASTGLAQQVMTTLRRRRLMFMYLLPIVGFGIGIGIPLLAISLLNPSWSMRGIVIVGDISHAGEALTLLCGVGLLLRFRRVPVLSLEKQSERRPFLETHKHDLLKGALLLFLGSLLTLAVQLILKWVK